ncbi:hypothetical protein FD723_10775 [Nostoc sp. C052]|uniref:hypothetical protein n=1 Tax=Nostoc sp. C052 TaxID=2576902 RepID=UPI0015C32E0F|nr:hypothetical protein [Nostoc sp. C052]QLE40895.1 hypothetical protein FD723_10775 [Nostoc sp. C052]
MSTILFANQPQRLQQIQYPVIPADHRLSRNGSPFFPIGFYYVDYDRPPQQFLEGQIQALKDIANAGFNVLHTSINYNLSAHTTLLKQAERLGVTIISDHQADFARTQSLQTFKNSPALLAWSIGDDINRNYQPQEILRVHTQVKAQDPRHATYVSMFDGNRQVIKRYMHVADWVGMQSYPVANRSLDSTFYEINSAVETALSSHGSLIIANLQTFKWPTEREPSAAEIRNMTYQALLAGVRGILYYTYRDRSWYLPNHSQLWAEMKSIAQELKYLQPWLLDATLQRIELQAYPQVMTGIWQARGRKTLVVLNTTQKRQSLSIKLPSSSLHVTSLLNERPISFSTKYGVLAVSIPPLEVQIYRLL